VTHTPRNAGASDSREGLPRRARNGVLVPRRWVESRSLVGGAMAEETDETDETDENARLREVSLREDAGMRVPLT
jgi:hypothetical protein